MSGFAAEELTLVVQRDGHPELVLPVWVVEVDGTPYLRSYQGVGSMWFRRVLARTEQAVELDGVRVPATFEPIGGELEREISDAFLAKYAGYEYAPAMVTPEAVAATVRVRVQAAAPR